jgi:hypothetical protein
VSGSVEGGWWFWKSFITSVHGTSSSSTNHINLNCSISWKQQTLFNYQTQKEVRDSILTVKGAVGTVGDDLLCRIGNGITQLLTQTRFQNTPDSNQTLNIPSFAYQKRH